MRYFQLASGLIDIIRIQHSGVTRCSLEKLVRPRTFLKLHILVFTDQVTAVLAPVMSKIDIVISFFDDLIVMLYHKQCILPPDSPSIKNNCMFFPRVVISQPSHSYFITFSNKDL